MAEQTRYFHGGPTIDGRWLLPPATTGVARVAHGEPWVYITPHYTLALTYAATCDGWVYEVVPDSEPEPDPDSMLPAGDSLRCRSARIVRRFRPPRADVEAATRAMRLAGALTGEAVDG